MDTLTSPELAPVPIEIPALPVGPPCVLCGAPALVHWLRRLTDAELAELHAVENDRRTQARLLANPQLPPPVFPTLPTGHDATVAVYACGPHAITLEAAAHIHSSACTAPNEADLPACDCVPERLPTEPPEEPGELPEHWLPGGQ